MPENFTLTFSTPQLYNRMILKSAEKKTERLIDSIKSKQEHLPSKKKTNEAAYEKNKANWHLLAEDFSVKDNCTKCKKCIRLCPVENVLRINNIYRLLNSGGVLVFSQEHPLNTCFSNGSRWTKDENGNKLFANIARYIAICSISLIFCLLKP